jgi:hypothetical protein
MVHVVQRFPSLAESDPAIAKIGDFVRFRTASTAAAR